MKRLKKKVGPAPPSLDELRHEHRRKALEEEARAEEREREAQKNADKKGPKASGKEKPGEKRPNRPGEPDKRSSEDQDEISLDDLFDEPKAKRPAKKR